MLYRIDNPYTVVCQHEVLLGQHTYMSCISFFQCKRIKHYDYKIKIYFQDFKVHIQKLTYIN